MRRGDIWTVGELSHGILAQSVGGGGGHGGMAGLDSDEWGQYLAGGSGSFSFGTRSQNVSLSMGGSGGSGTLTFQGRRYDLGIGGLSYGFTFGASETWFRGTVSNINRASDVSGVYAAGNVGAAVGRGAQAIVLTNQHGAVLTLSGNSVGAIVSADLNGLVITVR